MQSQLQSVGYVETVSLTDNLLTLEDGKLRGHEFHFSTMTPNEPERFPWAFEFVKTRTGQRYYGGYANGNILASYLHLHFAGNEEGAKRFLVQCKEYRMCQ